MNTEHFQWYFTNMLGDGKAVGYLFKLWVLRTFPWRFQSQRSIGGERRGAVREGFGNLCFSQMHQVFYYQASFGKTDGKTRK